MRGSGRSCEEKLPYGITGNAKCNELVFGSHVTSLEARGDNKDGGHWGLYHSSRVSQDLATLHGDGTFSSSRMLRCLSLSLSLFSNGAPAIATTFPCRRSSSVGAGDRNTTADFTTYQPTLLVRQRLSGKAERRGWRLRLTGHEHSPGWLDCKVSTRGRATSD